MKYRGRQDIFQQSSISTGTNHQSNRWTDTKIKHFCPAMETPSRYTDSLGMGENLTNYNSDKGLIFMIIKELYKLNTKGIKTANQQRIKELN